MKKVTPDPSWDMKIPLLRLRIKSRQVSSIPSKTTKNENLKKVELIVKSFHPGPGKSGSKSYRSMKKGNYSFHHY